MAEHRGPSGGQARSAYWDNAKALLITLVVFTHTMGTFIDGDPALRSLHQLVLVFHMPAFIFVSGYLSRPDAFSRKGLRTLGTLAWTYLLFNLMNHLWAARFEGREFELARVVTAPSYALWFLIALVWWRLLLPLFARGESRRSTLLSIAVAVGAAVASGYVIRDGGYLSVSRTFMFLPFFVAGYRAKQQGWAVPRTWWTRVLAIAAFCGVYAALLFGDVIREDMLLYRSQSFIQIGNVTVWAAVAALTIMAAGAVLIASFLQFVPRSRQLFTAVGTTTLSVYVWHAFSLRNIREFGIDELLLGTWWSAALTTLLMVAVFGYGPIPKLTLWVTGNARKKAGT